MSMSASCLRLARHDRPCGDQGARQTAWDELLLDVNSSVEVALGSSRQPIDLPYRDLKERGSSIDVFSLPEIVVNKWYMLNDRKEPRDLFDIWSGLLRFGVSFEMSIVVIALVTVSAEFRVPLQREASGIPVGDQTGAPVGRSPHLRDDLLRGQARI